MVKVEFIKAFENVFSGYSGISCRDDDHTEQCSTLTFLDSRQWASE